MRAEATFKDMDIDVIFHMIVDVEIRKLWDSTIPQITLVELINSNEDVIAIEMSMPSPVTNREMLQHRAWVCNKTNSDLVAKYKLYEKENKYYALVLNSITREDVPEKKNLVRGETIIGGWILEQDSKNPKNTSFKFVMHSDPKGSIPGFLVKKGTSKIAIEFITGLQKGYSKVEAIVRKKYGI